MKKKNTESQCRGCQTPFVKDLTTYKRGLGEVKHCFGNLCFKCYRNRHSHPKKSERIEKGGQLEWFKERIFQNGECFNALDVFRLTDLYITYHDNPKECGFKDMWEFIKVQRY